jgi:predicted RNA-binding Zn ribbon-like protein
MSEELLLALLNSTPKVDGVRQDYLADDAAVQSWLASHAPRGLPAGDLRAVRAALRDVVRGTASPEALAPFLDDVASRPLTTVDGLAWRIDGDSVAVRVILAWDELRTSAPCRLKPCANTACQRFLLDHSKANNARWCSMSACGNRMKARRHYARVREGRAR